MCHAFLDYPTYKRMQEPHALWRCGVCGRQSTRPIDCCSRPDYARQRQPGIARLAGRQLVGVGSVALTRLRAWWHRRHNPAMGGVTVPARDLPAHDADTGVRIEEAVGTELVGTGRD